MLALDGARLRRSLAMTKQDCSDRYQIAAAVVAQPVQLYTWPGNGLAEKVSLNPLAAFGLSATTR